MTRSSNPKYDKKVYSVQDIQDILGIGRTTAYEFIRNTYENRKPFKVIKIGDTYKIPKDSFDKWIEGD